MKSFHNFMRLLGLLMTVGGIAAAGFLYRDMKTENLMHARTGVVRIDPASAGDWTSTTFTLYRPGIHIIYLSLGKPGQNPGQAATSFQGEIEIEVLSPDGNQALQSTLTAGRTGSILRDSVSWIALDSMDVADPTRHSWTMRARTNKPDSTFSHAAAEAFVLPPQEYEIGSYLYGEIFTLIGMGLVSLTGFALIVFAGYLQQRKKRQDMLRSQNPGT